MPSRGCEFPGKRLLFGAFLGSMMLPGVVLFIPNFILVRDLGWLNTMAGMVAPFALMSGFAVFFLRQFFLSVPRELEEAAVLDGAGHFTIFWRVVLPLSTGPLATLAMLTGIGAWNEFFWPFVVSPGRRRTGAAGGAAGLQEPDAARRPARLVGVDGGQYGGACCRRWRCWSWPAGGWWNRWQFSGGK